MTAVLQNSKKIKKLHKIFPEGISPAPAAVWFFMAVSRANARWADIPLPFLALVLTAANEDRLYKPITAAGATAALALLAVKDIYFLPYTLGCIIYILFYGCINEKLRLPAGTAIFALSKVVLVCFSQSFSCVLYTAAESGAILGLAGIISSIDDIPPSVENFSSGDVVTLFLSSLTYTIILSARDSIWLYTGAACALAVAWIYAQKSSFFYSISWLICVFFALMDKNRFYITAGCFFIVWLAGIIYSEKNSLLIYPVTAVTALLLNIALLAQLGGFTLIATTLAALLIYTLLPRFLPVPDFRKPDFFTREKDYRQLMLGVRKLENSLNYLGSCAMDISLLNEKNLTGRTLEDMVAEDICRNCELSSHCWQEKYSYTAQQFSKYAKSISWTEETGFDMSFYSHCIRVEKVKKSFEENSRLLLSRKYTAQSQKNNQKLLQTAFMSIAAAIGDLAHYSRSSRLVNSTITMQTSRLLDSMDVAHSYCLCSQNPDKATFSATDSLPESRLYKIKLRLEQLYGEKFTDGESEISGNEILYTFYAKPFFTRENRVKSSAFRQVNGDGHRIFTIANTLYVLLSDGMGTGAAAAAESRTALEMTRSLLEAQTGILNTINIVNLSMNLRGGSESGASMDILAVDMYTGKATLTKAGAGVTSVLKADGSMTRYYKDSLPLGVVKDTRTRQEEFVLNSGDTVIMMSDGVGNISSNIRNLYDASCEEIAKFAINENKVMDDKTVIVIRLKKR